MEPLLHESEALAEIATSWDEPARSWARALLRIWWPDRPTLFPTADLAWDHLLVRAEDPASAIALEVAPLTEGGAALVASLPAWGHPISEGLRRACESAVSADGGPADLWLALALARSGAVGASAVRAAARGVQPATAWVLAAVILHFLQDRDEATAAQAFGGLSDDEAWAALIALGIPEDLPEPPRDLDAALAAGRALGGGERVSPSAARGSRKHRARALIAPLLASSEGPLRAALSAALAAPRSPVFEARVVAATAWWTGRRGDVSPLERVLEHRAGPEDWAAAWREAAEKPETVARALPRLAEGSLGAAVLAARLDPSAAASRVLEPISRTPSLSWLSVGAALAPHLAPLLPAWIRGPHRDVALPLAAWAPTPAVLDVLLEIPVPASPSARRDWAWALASTGDRVAAGRVEALANASPRGSLGQGPDLVQALGLGT